MARWTVGASRSLPILDSARSWDGPAAKRRIFAWAGWDDNPDPAKARRAFLVYDADAPELKGSYKLPFADVVDGRLVAVPSGLRAAASRLPQADLPENVKRRARAVLDAYFERMRRAEAAAKSYRTAWDDLAGAPEVRVLGLPYGGPNPGDVDSYGERFTPATDIWLDPGDVVPVTYYHTLEEQRPQPLGYARYEGADEEGHWFVARLDRSHPMFERVWQALQGGGDVRASSGAAVHLVRQSGADIEVWPVAELAIFDVQPETQRLPANEMAVVIPADNAGAKTTGGDQMGEEKDTKVQNAQPDGQQPAADAGAEDVQARWEQAVSNVLNAVEQAAVRMAEAAERVEKAVQEVVERAGQAEVTPRAQPAVRTAARHAKRHPWLLDDEAAFVRGMRALALGAARVVYVPLTREEFDARFRALSTGTDTAGGYLVATEHAAQLIELLTARAVVRRAGATVVPMSTNVLEIPSQTGGATAYWVAENATITASDQTFGLVQLTTKKLAALTQVSREMIEDSSPSVEAIVRNDLARVLALAEDLAYLRGDGTGGQPVGILNTTGVTVTELGTGNGATPTFDDLADAIYRLDAANAPAERRAWVVHPRTANTLRKIKDSNNQYIWADPAAPGDPPTVWGYPVFYTTQIPINLTVGTSTNASEIYLGAWGEALIGQRRSLELRASDVAGTAFQADQVWVRATMRVAFALRHTESFEVLTGVLP